MTKIEDDLINQIRTNKGEKNKISKKLNAIFCTFFKILDFNELDVNRYLSIKDSKKYKSLIRKKFLIYLLFETLILINTGYLLFVNEYEIELTNWSIPHIIWIIFMVILINTSFLLGKFSSRIITKIVKNFNYGMPYYRKEKKKMKKLCKQFNLIINNQQLIEEIGEENYINKYKNNIEKINNRINYYSNLFRSLDYYIIQFGIFSIGITTFSPIIYEILSGGIQVRNINDDVLFIGLIIPISLLIIFLSLYQLNNRSLNKRLYSIRNHLIVAELSLSYKLEDIAIYLQYIGLRFFLKARKSSFNFLARSDTA